MITEATKLANYFQFEYKFSYMMTASGAEVDLVVERPGQKILLVEIKSSNNVQELDLTTLRQLAADFGECETICLSQDERPKKLGDITVYPWREGIEKYFT